VDIEPGTKLYKIFGETSMWVNSSHHQAVKLHGKGLIVNAKSPDGVVEGLEHPGKKWVIGVQWHPELYWRNDRLMAKLFKEFVDACG
jgi:putative glutamine amidotransferase